MSTQPEITFRVATLEDASAIRSFIESAFRASDPRTSWTADEKLNQGFTLALSQVESIITKPNSAFIIAETLSSALVGTIGTFRRPDGLGRLAMLAVDQSLQRAGLGRRVLEKGEEYCRAVLGVKKVGLDALSSRAALIEWYERRGYVRTGERVPFPAEGRDGADEGLYFVQFEKEIGGELEAK